MMDSSHLNPVRNPIKYPLKANGFYTLVFHHPMRENPSLHPPKPLIVCVLKKKGEPSGRRS